MKKINGHLQMGEIITPECPAYRPALKVASEMSQDQEMWVKWVAIRMQVGQRGKFILGCLLIWPPMTSRSLADTIR